MPKGSVGGLAPPHPPRIERRLEGVFLLFLVLFCLRLLVEDLLLLVKDLLWLVEDLLWLELVNKAKNLFKVPIIYIKNKIYLNINGR